MPGQLKFRWWRSTVRKHPVEHLFMPLAGRLDAISGEGDVGYLPKSILRWPLATA